MVSFAFASRRAVCPVLRAQGVCAMPLPALSCSLLWFAPFFFSPTAFLSLSSFHLAAILRSLDSSARCFLMRTSCARSCVWFWSCPRGVEQKTAVAVTHCKKGRGLIKLNGEQTAALPPSPPLFPFFTCVRGDTPPPRTVLCQWGYACAAVGQGTVRRAGHCARVHRQAPGE